CWHGLGCTRSGVVETWTMALDVAPSSSAEPLSPFLATVAVMKAIVGLCCLTLPAAFAEVRLTLALLGIVLVCVALGTGTYRVAQCYVQIRRSQDGGEEDHGLGPLGDISREVFGWQGIRFCYVAILASQFGLAVAYTDVIVPTVMKMLGLSKLTVQLWVFGISGILSFIKQLQGLAWLSIVALAEAWLQETLHGAPWNADPATQCGVLCLRKERFFLRSYTVPSKLTRPLCTSRLPCFTLVLLGSRLMACGAGI
ncbi:unnamed protein product, partial [Symbiodinium sp. KB8]